MSRWWQSRWAGVTLCGAIFLAVGLLTQAWTRPLNSDEKIYYEPAIRFVAERLPALPLREYPFPGPPLGLWIQALTWAVGHGVVAVRILSTLCALGLAIYLFATTERRELRLRNVALLTFPFFLWNVFTIKQHALTVLFLLIGLVGWQRLDSRRRSIWTCGFLSAAVLTNQFSSPLCLACCVDSLLRRQRVATIVVGIPLVLLGALVLFWGGLSPPGFHAPPAPRQLLAQLTLGFVTLGAWVMPLAFSKARHGRILILALLPAVAIAWFSKLYAPGADFWLTAQGPISRTLQVLSRIHPLLPTACAGGLAALGFAFLMDPVVAEPWRRQIRLCAAVYLAISAAGVPYLFESYYLLLIMPVQFLLTEHLPGGVASLRHRLVFAAMTLAGIGYAVLKLREPG